ncbi:MAG: peptidoglycan DD-metalloendopeptidase family protein [Nonlabens sp.]
MKGAQLLLGLMIVLVSNLASAQSKQALEERKQALQKEINQYDRLLKDLRKEEANMQLLVRTIDKKIAGTQEVINITNRQANLITRDIKSNTAQVNKLQAEVKELKSQYADMVVKSYKKNNERSRLMFLLSSENFLQAYKRVQYLNAYADYRKKQALEITEKSKEVANKIQQLEVEKKQKVAILASNRKQKQQLVADKKEQENLIAAVQKDEQTYLTQIKVKAKERDKIYAQIKKLIAADIAKSNKGKKNTVANKFFLTPAARALSSNFKSNRGKLPWPIKEGFISMKYGKQRSPIVPTAEINSYGLRFQAPKNADARAIFKGEVVYITRKRNGILGVHVRHGAYTSIYENLKSTTVKSGDQVDTGDVLGTIFTDRTGATELRFILMQDAQTLDPGRWLAR